MASNRKTMTRKLSRMEMTDVQQHLAKNPSGVDKSGISGEQVLDWLKKRLAVDESKPSKQEKKPGEEAVVLLTGRPVFLSKNHVAQVPANTIEAWKTVLEKRGANINAALGSVGRVNLENCTKYKWVGTAWLVSIGVAVTNRHVAETFAEKGPKGYRFKTDPTSQKIMKASIDFYNEYDVNKTDSHVVSQVLYISEDPEADIAFLRVEGVEKYPLIELSDSKIVEEINVAVIGYPAADSQRNPAPEALLGYFNNIYDVKRIAPGKVLNTPDAYGVFHHDATTLGGNSGSLVLEISTGKALGLHFAGEFKKANYALNASMISKYMKSFVLHENPILKAIGYDYKNFLESLPVTEGPDDPTPPTDPKDPKDPNTPDKEPSEEDLKDKITKPSGSDEDGVVAFVNCMDDSLAPELKEQYKALEYLVGLGYRFLQKKGLDPRKATSWQFVMDNMPFVSPGAFVRQTLEKTVAGAEISTTIFDIIRGPSATDVSFLERFRFLLAGTQKRITLSMEQTKKTVDVMLLARVIETVRITPTVSMGVPKLKLYSSAFDLNSWVVKTPGCGSANKTSIKLDYYQAIGVLNYDAYFKAKEQLEKKYSELELDKLKFFDGDLANK